MMSKLEQILNAAHLDEVIALGIEDSKANQKQPSTVKRVLLAIDVQNDFMDDGGSLGVSGAKEDVKRLNQWIYRNIAHLDSIVCSLDTHQINQIFHPAWWVDKEGNAPAPFTIITLEMVETGVWAPKNSSQLEYAKTYLNALIEKGYKELCIWPYHCLEGSYGHQLESHFLNMLYYHSAYHSIRPQLISKGEDPNTEMYGIIKAEYDPSNQINQTVLDTIKQADEVYIAGEASSHCVLASITQIAEYFKDQPAMTSKIVVLKDCMSPITGFEQSTQEAFQQLEKEYKIQFKMSSKLVLGK